MAILANIQSGNFTSASTWSVIDPTSFLATTTASTPTGTTYVESQSFTPGAITIDAIGIRLNGASGNTGTFSVRLALLGVTVLGTEVTINASDLSVNNIGFVLMKFAAPVTLMPLMAYTVSVRSSVASTVSVARNATAGNWNRFLRTTTTQAPAVGDTLYVTGEYISAGVNNSLTVTCDNTASTIFGALDINAKGIFASGVTASTAYTFITNTDTNIRGEGTLQLGTLASPIPQSSSFVYQVNQSGVNVNFGMIITANGTLRSYGATKTTKALLAANASVGATSLTTNISTGWLSGDNIGIAPTGSAVLELESRILSANAVGTTLTIPALTFGHLGSGDFIAEILNLTRNVVIKSDSTSFGTYILNSGASTVDLNYTQLSDMGSNTASKRGFDVLTSTGSFNVLGCAIVGQQNNSIAFLCNQGTNANITFDDCVFYSTKTAPTSIQTNAGTSAPLTITNCWSIASTFSFSHRAGSINNIRVSGAGSGITISNTTNSGLTISDLICHTNSTNGIGLSSSTLQGQLISNITTWRNLRAINTNGCSNIILDNHISYGNTFSGISITNSANVTVQNSNYYGSTGIVQPSGVVLEATSLNIFFNNCIFGSPTANSSGDVNVSTARSWHDTKFNNCLFGSTNEVTNRTNLAQNAFIGSSKHDQTNGIHKGWKRTATLNSDSVIQATAPLSVRITPSVSTTKTFSSSTGFAIPSGKTATVSVLVRRSVAGDGTAYNGTLPRLWLRQNNSAGISTDTLLATATAASLGAFEALIGSIPAATDNTVNYLYIDCDGTTGWINIDKWNLVINNGSANGTNINYEDYWQDGLSYPGINTTLMNNTNQETYWIDGAPVPQLYPVSTIQTGRFFLLFD